MLHIYEIVISSTGHVEFWLRQNLGIRVNCQGGKNVSTPLDTTGVAFHWSIGGGVLACPSPPTRDCDGNTRGPCAPQLVCMDDVKQTSVLPSVAYTAGKQILPGV